MVTPRHILSRAEYETLASEQPHDFPTDYPLPPRDAIREMRTRGADANRNRIEYQGEEGDARDLLTPPRVDGRRWTREAIDAALAAIVRMGHLTPQAATCSVFDMSLYDFTRAQREAHAQAGNDPKTSMVFEVVPGLPGVCTSTPRFRPMTQAESEASIKTATAAMVQQMRRSAAQAIGTSAKDLTTA